MLRVIQYITGFITVIAIGLQYDTAALVIGGVSFGLLIFNIYTGRERSSSTDKEIERRFF
jgi:hypothetical protein